MRKKHFLLSLLLLIFPLITLSNIFGNNLLDDVRVSVSFNISNDNTIMLEEETHPYGTSFSIDFNEVDNNYNFLYWIVDGVIDLEKDMYGEFIVTRDLNLIGVFHENDEFAVTFIDYSGKLIETKYLKDYENNVLEPLQLPNKPGYEYNNPKWVSIKGSVDLNDVTEASVFKLNYKRTTNDSFVVNVNGGTVSNKFPAYNEVVTVTSNISNFTHWEENNVPVSYEKEYSFSALSNRNLIAKSDGQIDNLITITPNLNLRETHQSYLSTINLKENSSLIEHGFITINNDSEETIYKSTLLLKTTNEFLGSFNNDLNIAYIKAYAVIKINNSYQTIYSNYALKTNDFHETFDDLDLPSNSYTDKIFTGINDIKWDIIEGRSESTYPINGKGILLRGKDNDYSASLTGSFPNGLNSLSFEFRKAFTSNTDRNYNIDITNNGFITTYIIPSFGKSGTDDTIYNFTLNNLNFYGNTIVKIYATNNAQATFDNFKWTDFINEVPPQKINISFDLNYTDAPSIPNQIINVGTTPFKPENPIRGDYSFLGWYINDNPYNFNQPLNNDTVLLAKWGVNTGFITVNFILNNDDNDIEQIIPISSLLVQPENISNGDKVFIGWFEDESFEGEPWNFNTDIAVRDITLYAQWGNVFSDTLEVMGTKTQLDDEHNNARLVSLDPNYFNVITNKVGNNKVGVYDEIRFYKDNQLDIIINESFIISKLEFKFSNTENTNNNVQLSIGNDNFILENYLNKSFIYDDLNITSFSIKHLGLANQVRIDNIKITYYQIGPDVLKEDDINRPIFDFSDNDLYILNVGEPLDYPEIYAYDEEDGRIHALIDYSKTDVNYQRKGIYYIHYYAYDSDENLGEGYITVIYRNENSLDDYYGNTLDLSNQSLYNNLSSILKNTLDLTTYGTAKEVLEISDRDPNLFNNVWLIYNGASIKGKWDSPNYAREHVWAKSAFGGNHSISSNFDGYGTKFSDNYRGAASDLHNLRAINPAVNSTHSNYEFTNSNGIWKLLSVSPRPLNPHTPGNIATTTNAFYPGDDHKGDVARIIFYMILTWDLTPREDINMLINWHLEDPVDNFEIIRNEVIYQYQENRNPFIDYPELVERVFSN